MKKVIVCMIAIAMLLLSAGIVEAGFNVGIYYNNPTSRIAGFDELNTTTHNILVVKDLATGDSLPAFSVTGASSNWDKIVNSSGMQYYPNMLDMHNLTGNPNLWGLWLGLGSTSGNMLIKYISKVPIAVDNFSVGIQAWSGYGAEGSQSRGVFFDYVDMAHTYLARINGDRSYIVEDLSTGAILSAGNFYGDNYNPNINTIVEVRNLTDTDMHVKIYCMISPAPYERLFFEGNLPRQKVADVPEEPPEENKTTNTTIIYHNTTTRVVTDKGISNYYTNTTNVFQNITYLNQTIVYENKTANDTLPPPATKERDLSDFALVIIIISCIVIGMILMIIILISEYRNRKK